jgi:hypothetical protein
VTTTALAAAEPPPPRPILDRLISPRSRSAEFPIHTDPRLEGVALHDVDWDLTIDFPLDQGAEGACVGFGTSAELSAEPMQWPTGNAFAQTLYQRARARDRARGYDFPSGATVLAGLEAAREMGLIQGFRWAQRFDDIALGLMVGPVVMGTDVTEGMYETTAEGEWVPVGPYIGGHCWVIIGFRLNHPTFGRCYLMVNSWGARFGFNGKAWIREESLRKLWDRGGEAAIVTDTTIVPVTPPPPVVPTPPQPRTPEPSRPKPAPPKRRRPWWWNPTRSRKAAASALRRASELVEPRSP